MGRVSHLIQLDETFSSQVYTFTFVFQHKLHPDQYTAPKEMIEFSRRHQEQRLVKEQEEELRKLTEEEIQLEEKLQQLFELDRRLQEKSFHVSSLQDNKVSIFTSVHNNKVSFVVSLQDN